MSIFNTILQKLGIEKPAAPAASSAPSATPYSPVSSSGPASTSYTPVSSSGPAPSAAPVNMPMVDVVSKLDRLQASFNNPQLTWRVSISDLLYILKLDNSGNGLKELATELQCPPEFMGDSAKRNTWLHTTVLKKIAENGGNIPAELLKK
jgi:hypothetical protein